MSQHNSFKSAAGASSTNRTVLKRFERVELLKKRGQWDDKRTRLSGLPKTRPEA
ncbi:MAG: small basic protein [Opitutales bacterium]|nr:small basic protein [Opitutales bacterium]